MARVKVATVTRSPPEFAVVRFDEVYVVCGKLVWVAVKRLDNAIAYGSGQLTSTDDTAAS